MDRGEKMELSTPGKKISVVVGTSLNKAKRPKPQKKFTRQDARSLKADLGFGHKECHKVKITQYSLFH